MRTASLILSLLVVSSAYGVGLFPLTPSDPTILNSNARGLTVGADGTVYVAGQVKVDATNSRAAYWTAIGGVVGAPVIPAANDAGTTATQANGVGLMANGSVLLSGNLGGGASDWNSGLAATNGGWNFRYAANGTTQGSLGGTANLLAAQANGTGYYMVGKTPSAADTGLLWNGDGTTGGASLTTWSVVGPSATTKAGTVTGITPAGVAVGEARASSANIRRGYVYDSATATRTFLLGLPGRTDNRAQPQGISADGATVVGYGRKYDADLGYDSPFYWTKDAGGAWSVAKKLGRLAIYDSDPSIQAGVYSSSFAFSADQTGKIIVGTEYPGLEVGAFWDTTVLDGNGLPQVNILKDWLAAHGVDVSGWSNLGRTYSAYTVDGVTYVSGDGAWITDPIAGTTVTRGFIAAIPEPASLMLLTLGGALLLRRRSSR